MTKCAKNNNINNTIINNKAQLLKAKCKVGKTIKAIKTIKTVNSIKESNNYNNLTTDSENSNDTDETNMSSTTTNSKYKRKCARRHKWTYGLEQAVFYKQNNPKGVGRCWHCGIKLHFERRLSKHGPGVWNMDHYPVRYRDIKDQWCFGVRCPRDVRNLVPSCEACNKSHKYEVMKRYYCGRSQCLCTRRCTYMSITFGIVCTSLLTIGTALLYM
jgi:hypothetical protein